MPTDVEREPLRRILRDADSEIADLYEGGIRIAEWPSFPARGPILAHVVRELRKGIPDAILGKADSHLDYHHELAPVQAAWEQIRQALPDSTQMLEPDATMAVPIDVVRTLDNVLRADVDVGNFLRQRFVTMCAVVNGEEPWSGNALLAEQWMNLSFHGIAHMSVSDSEQLALDGFATLESLALRVFAYAADREPAIRERASTATAATIVQHVRQLVTLHEHYVFFQALRSPDLIEALDAANLFTIPSENSPVYWPQGDYLVAMAERAPERVTKILTRLEPRHPGTRYQLLQGVLKLPGASLLSLARNALWLRVQPNIRYRSDYIDLVHLIAEAGDIDLALKFAKRVLQLVSEAPPSDIAGFDHPRAVPAVGETAYESVLERLATALESVDPMRVLSLLASTLDAAIRIERYDRYDWGTPSFRDMLAERPDYGDAKTRLAAAIVRLAFKTAETRADAVLQFLRERSRNKRTYTRMAHAVVVRYSLADDAERFMRECADGWRNADPEHVALVERFYPGLSEEARAEIAAFAHETLRDLLTGYFERQGVGADAIEQRVYATLARAFGSAASAIPAPLRARVTDAVASAQVPIQPPSFEHLATLAPRAVAAELHRWLPTSDTPFDTPWSVGSALRILFERHGADWLSDLEACRAIPDYFLGWAFNGLHGYRRTTGAPNDEAILSLSDYVLARAVESLRSGDPMRLGIARHLGQGVGLLLADVAKVPDTDDAISRMLGLARTLANVHPTETSEVDTSPYSGPQSALGEPRALAVVIAAELLLRAHHNGLNTTGIADLYDELAADDSIPVRGALGQFFSWFATTHEARAEDWARRIFLSGEEDADRAAWAGYVTFSDVNATSHRLLRGAYELRLLETTLHSNPSESVEERRTTEHEVHIQILWHVWVLIANRVERFEDPASLANVMLENSDPRLVEELLRRIGHTLERDGASPQGEVILAEAMALWTRVRERIAGGTYPIEALTAFPSWAKVSTLPSGWRLDEIERVFDTRDRKNVVLNSEDLVEGLIEIAAVEHKRALRLMERLARATQIDALVALQLHAGPLLREAVRGDEEEAHLARRINSVLVSNHRPNLLADEDPVDP
ncbi:MAG: hypothetical protein WB609_05570 [Candidatus Cybelea sp.]